jgi:hypothetical protein
MGLKEINSQFNNELQQQINRSNRTGIIDINSIRSVYPKDQSEDILSWINSGLLRYVDKKKALTFIQELHSQFAQKSCQNIKASIYNIVNAD